MKKSPKQFAPTLAGDVALTIAEGMAAEGREKGVLIDKGSRLFRVSSPLTRDLEMSADSPQCREKIIFATRIAPVFYNSYAGSLLAYEDKASRPGAEDRYIDVAMRSATSPEKTVGLFEIKIAAGADPWPEIENALSQLRDYAERLNTAGRLAPLLAASILVFSKSSLENPTWRCSDYFNAQGGQGSAKPGGNLREQAKELLRRHGMVCLSWLFDLSTHDKAKLASQAFKDGSAFNNPPASFTVFYAGEFPMKGKGCVIVDGASSITISADSIGIGRSPTCNVSGGSQTQNTRNYGAKPVSRPGEERSKRVIETIKSLQSQKLSKSQIEAIAETYTGTQTGANARRIMAIASESLHCKMDDGGNGTLLLLSTNCALSDGQSSTACFSAMAHAARESSSFSEYCKKLSKNLLFYGIEYTFPESLGTKLFENCKIPSEEQDRFDLFKKFVLSPVFDVKIEFPTTQEEGALASRVANEATGQSSVDLSLARHRRTMQELHDNGKQAAKELNTEFPFELPKHHNIEKNDNLPITDLIQFHYTGESAAPGMYGGNCGTKPPARLLNNSKSGASLYGKKIRLANGPDAQEELNKAISWAHRAGQALSRCGFEGASEEKRLQAGAHFLMPDLQKTLDFVEPVRLGFFEALDGQGGQAGVARGLLEIKKQRSSLRREAKGINPDQQRQAREILDWLEADLSSQSLQEMQNDEAFLRKHFDVEYSKAIAKTRASQNLDRLMRSAELVRLCHQAAIEIEDQLPPMVELKAQMIQRMLCVSIQLSFEDGGLGGNGQTWEQWRKKLPARLTIVSKAFQEKIKAISDSVSRRVSGEHFKSLGKGSMDMAYFHEGLFVTALPQGWQDHAKNEQENRTLTVYPAYKSAPVWLLHAGLQADGSWSAEASKLEMAKPLILISDSPI